METVPFQLLDTCDSRTPMYTYKNKSSKVMCIGLRYSNGGWIVSQDYYLMTFYSEFQIVQLTLRVVLKWYLFPWEMCAPWTHFPSDICSPPWREHTATSLHKRSIQHIFLHRIYQWPFVLQAYHMIQHGNGWNTASQLYHGYPLLRGVR